VFCAVLTPRLVDDLRVRALRRWAGLRAGKTPAFVAVASGALLLGFVAGVGAAVATNALYRYDSVTRRTGFGLSDLSFPVAAAQFVEHNALAGNMLNDYSVGTYLNWRLFPARRTFIDGHTYSAARLSEYLKFMGGGTSYQAIAAKYDVGFFFLSHKSVETRALILKLLRDPNWALVYFDEMAMIFAANRPENAAVIARQRIDPGALSALPRELANIRQREDFYLGHTDRGLILSVLGATQAATSELEKAVAENPKSFVSLTALGNQRSQNRRFDEGAAACAAAIALRSRYAPAHACLGVLRLQQNRTKEAIVSLERAVALNPKAPTVHFNLGVAYENDGDRTRALEQYRKELEVNPPFTPAQEAVRRLTR
jgi:tetratricopeptide (TPR) repeat protein